MVIFLNKNENKNTQLKAKHRSFCNSACDVHGKIVKKQKSIKQKRTKKCVEDGGGDVL
jgi:hypothetical protein